MKITVTFYRIRLIVDICCQHLMMNSNWLSSGFYFMFREDNSINWTFFLLSIDTCQMAIGIFSRDCIDKNLKYFDNQKYSSQSKSFLSMFNIVENYSRTHDENYLWFSTLPNDFVSSNSVPKSFSGFFLKDQEPSGDTFPSMNCHQQFSFHSVKIFITLCSLHVQYSENYLQWIRRKLTRDISCVRCLFSFLLVSEYYQ